MKEVCLLSDLHTTNLAYKLTINLAYKLKLILPINLQLILAIKCGFHCK